MNEIAKINETDLARCPGRSVQDIFDCDTVPPPQVLRDESYEFLGSDDISPTRYTSQKFFDREFDRVWKRTWQYACRNEHIPEAGDNFVYKIGNVSIIIVRTETSDVKAYYNVCRHRGTQLRASAGIGHSPELRCPFHGWTWKLDGSIKSIPCQWDFNHVDPGKFALSEVKVATWQGFIFVNMDPAAPPLEDFLAPVPEHFANWDMENRYIATHVEKELECNWKAAIEAFVEFYHIPETHSQLVELMCDVNSQNDVYGVNVSRILAPLAVSSPTVENPPSAREVLNRMVVGDASVSREGIPLNEGESARSAMARYLRGLFGEVHGKDYSTTSDAEMIDTIQYYVFPSLFLWPGVSLPLIYRIRPDGMSPDRCTFEIMYLRPRPLDGDMPEPAEPIRLTEPESFTTVPEIDRASAETFDQDIDNLRSQREGYRFIDKNLTLSNYQEIRVRHLHRAIDLYLETEKTAELCLDAWRAKSARK